MSAARGPAGRPPNAREGAPVSLKGRLVGPGIAPSCRVIPVRATASDLWAPLDALTYDASRLGRLHGTSLDTAASRRFGAFVRQAREYFNAVSSVEPVAKPLLAYYFMLNLVKAFLTAKAPAVTAPPKIGHGLSSSETTRQRYRFAHETLKIDDSGVFRLFAERTGAGFCWPNRTQIPVIKLLPYLVEAFDLLQDSGVKSQLLPVREMFVWMHSTSPGGAAWIRVEVGREVLQRYAVQPSMLPRHAAIFGQDFRLVFHDGDPSTCSYESAVIAYKKHRGEAALGLASMYDRCIFGYDRVTAGGRRYVTLSQRPQLLSHEAVSFAVMLHLSNMVRYRPHRVESLLEDRYSWLVRAWVDRAVENFLLGVSSRIICEDQVIG